VSDTSSNCAWILDQLGDESDKVLSAIEQRSS